MLDILFVTDYVCPYCIVAKTALKKAIQELEIDAMIMTQPYELTPMNRDRVDTYSDPVRREHYKVLDEPVKELGLDVHIPPCVIPRPYTHYAFEGYFFAMNYGKEEEYSDLVYEAYFTKQQDIGDIEVLTKIIQELDLDVVKFKAVMSDHRYSSNVDSQVKYSKETLQVNSVPRIYINHQEVNVEAYSVEAFKKILLDPQYQSENVMGACGEDGCAIHF